MSDVRVAFVDSTSPLKIRETADATPVPARPVRGSSYSPVVNDPVLVVFVRGAFYVLGGA